MSITTYKELLNEDGYNDIKENCEWFNVNCKKQISLNELLEEKFDAGYGSANGKSFVIITKNWVYFPVVYDGAEWVDRVPRNPNEKFIPKHFGGG